MRDKRIAESRARSDQDSDMPERRCACGGWALGCWTVLITPTGSHGATGCDPRDIGTANAAVTTVLGSRRPRP
jgi:hypothetical protein